MTDTQQKGAVRHSDRKLGDEWADWDEGSSLRETEIDEGRKTFTVLAAIFGAFTLTMLPVVWYLIEPRIEQFSRYAAGLIGWILTGFIVLSVVLVLAELLMALRFGRSLFPYAWRQKIVLSLLPRTLWLGARLGISRDRVGNSFIKVHNFITKSHGDKVSTDRLLVLLPRCLHMEARKRITEKVGGCSVKIVTVSGGEAARAAIKQHRPTLILALACERDLMSGIRDVAEKIPVLAIANKRPEGPCKNTDFSMAELDEALEFITARKTRQDTAKPVSGS